VILVTGTIRARPDTIDQVESLSLAHVRRSRDEPGCLLHSVQRDLEDPLRLVFLEQWVDQDALRAHFGVPASRDFVAQVSSLADEPPRMTVFSAEAAGP
jgi:quinol monooxygenase YgiN